MAIDDIQDIPNPGQDKNILTCWKNWKKIKTILLEYLTLTPDSSTRNRIQPTDAAYIPLVVRGAASQSANLFVIENSAGTSLFIIGSSGLQTNSANALFTSPYGTLSDYANHRVNVFGEISASYLDTGGELVYNGSLNAYGVGTPGEANTEYIQLVHNTGTAYLNVIATGTGTYRDLTFATGGVGWVTLSTSGVFAMGGSATVAGTASIGSNLSAVGDFAINTNKFNITAATGNFSNAGTASISGNTTVGGTLGVTGVTTATGGLTLGASFVDKTTSLTSNTTLTSAHSTIFASASGGSFTLTLPAASGNTGLTYTIYKTDVSAAATGGGNTVTIDGNASETIGGSTTQVLASNTGVGRIKIICDGSNWHIQELYDEGTFILTLTGCTTSPTGTASYSRKDKIVSLVLPSGLGATSNANTATLTGLPSSCGSSKNPIVSTYLVVDNSSNYPGIAQIVSSTIYLGFYPTLTGGTFFFTSSGTKGVGNQTSFSYRQ
jgi:hypothetical protein